MKTSTISLPYSVGKQQIVAIHNNGTITPGQLANIIDGLLNSVVIEDMGEIETEVTAVMEANNLSFIREDELLERTTFASRIGGFSSTPELFFDILNSKSMRIQRIKFYVQEFITGF